MRNKSNRTMPLVLVGALSLVSQGLAFATESFEVSGSFSTCRTNSNEDWDTVGLYAEQQMQHNADAVCEDLGQAVQQTETTWQPTVRCYGISRTATATFTCE